MAGVLATEAGEAVEVVDEALDPAVSRVAELLDGFLANLPLLVIAFVVATLGIALSVVVATVVERGLRRRSADPAASGLLARVVRVLLIVAALLLALSVAGVAVGPAIAGLGLAGLGLAFALQAILENFFAGIILLIRKPFRAGDQIRTNDFEGTVVDIDLRVTKMIDYDGELILIPNAMVYTAPLVNLTRRGKRRTALMVGIDYRDDHDRAREVIRAAVERVEGVLPDPPVEVLLTELAESSVDFEVRYWSLPDIASVRQTQDRVLSAAKTAIQDAGMTIPWPIRTLSFDNRLQVDRDGRALPARREDVVEIQDEARQDG